MPLHDLLRQGTHAFAGSLNSHRILLYALVSTIALSAVILNALKNHSNFYSVAIYLSKSNRSVLVRPLTLCIVILSNVLYRYWPTLVFFLLSYADMLCKESFLALCGPMRSRYLLQLNPSCESHPDSALPFQSDSTTVYGSLLQSLSWHLPSSVMNLIFHLHSCLASCYLSSHFTGSQGIVLNGCEPSFSLISSVLKPSFQMDQRPYPGPSPLFHFRMSALFFILWATDFFMFLIAVENTIANGVGGMVLFASEVSHAGKPLQNNPHEIQYGILMASVLNTISKYLLSAYELRRARQRGGGNAPPWENKSMWIFYIELATGVLSISSSHPFSRTGIRFPQVDDLSRFLCYHHYFLWSSIEYCSGCLYHRSVVRFALTCSPSIPDSYPKYGSKVSQCDSRRNGRDE